MAVSVDTLKLTQVQGVIAVRETGTTPATGTIALATTLKKASETQSSPVVDISSVHWSLEDGATAKITRDSKVLHTLALSGTLEFYGFSDNENNDSDIEVDITGGAGTVILNCKKISGYGSQQHQGADGDLG
jgi:hypothetical protein